MGHADILGRLETVTTTCCCKTHFKQELQISQSQQAKQGTATKKYLRNHNYCARNPIIPSILDLPPDNVISRDLAIAAGSLSPIF